MFLTTQRTFKHRHNVERSNIIENHQKKNFLDDHRPLSLRCGIIWNVYRAFFWLGKVADQSRNRNVNSKRFMDRVERVMNNFGAWVPPWNVIEMLKSGVWVCHMSLVAIQSQTTQKKAKLDLFVKSAPTTHRNCHLGSDRDMCGGKIMKTITQRWTRLSSQ